MDTTLLQKQDPVAPGKGRAPGNHPEPVEINETETVGTATPIYREAEIAERKPPYRLRFEKPLEFNGETYAELIFDFDGMTGRDFTRIERKFRALYKPLPDEMPLPELNSLYHQILCGELADVPYHFIASLERRYYKPLITESLKACGSSPDEAKE